MTTAPLHLGAAFSFYRTNKMTEQLADDTTLETVAEQFDFTKEELRVAQIEFEQSCRRGMEELERRWRNAGRTIAWIDTEPKWLQLFWDYDTSLLPQPAMPCRRILRFTLVGGGQLRIIQHWIARPDPDEFSGPTRNSKTTVKITAHGDELRTASGEIDGVVYEMSADAIVLNGQGEVTQTLANRAAATLQLLSTATGNCTPPDRDRFFALLDGASGCC